MEKLSKSVINAILRTNLAQEVPPLGKEVASVLFKKNIMAFFVQLGGRGNEILLPPAYSEESVQKVILTLTDLIAVLSFLEKTKLIVLVEHKEPYRGVYYEQCDRFEEDQLPNLFHLSEELMLTSNQDELTRIINNGKVVLEKRKMSEHVIESLARFLNSSVLPTSALKEFVGRGYRTQEEQLTRRGLRYCIISMFIAVIVSVGSLIGNVWVGNKHGVSNINPIQIDSLLHSTRSVQITNDTIVVKSVVEENYGK